MNFKKTIAAVAITASSAFALTPPPTAKKTICLDARETNQGTLIAGDCDQAKNNVILKKTILDNGCAAGQISLQARSWGQPEKFNIEVHSCLPPNVVQL